VLADNKLVLQAGRDRGTLAFGDKAKNATRSIKYGNAIAL
jgi:hypothetical protein